MTVLMCLWGLMASLAAWWWRPIQLAKRRVRLGSRVLAWFMNSSSPVCREPPFTASDVVELYLHRGAFETTLADEDQEQDPDRWCSHTASGQEVWPIVFQLIRNLRLELGHQLQPDPVRTTEFAPALPPAHKESPEPPAQAPVQGYGPPAVALPWKAGRFSGQDFALQPDGTLRCPADQELRAHERRRESDGSLRVVYAASIRSCRDCSLREQCQWNGGTTAKPRQVSVLLHPLAVGSQPIFWRDWSRRHHRRMCMQLLRHQRVEVQVEFGNSAPPTVTSVPLSRAQRAHYRLDWSERLARNARVPTASQLTLRLFGVPEGFATPLSLMTAYHGDLLPLDSFSSDGHASPSGSSWPLFLTFPRFFTFSALFALHPSASPTSQELRVSF